MELPNHLRPFLQREGLIEVGRLPVREAARAIMRSIPTFADARRLTSLLCERLGDRASLEHENGPQRWLYLRDPEDSRWLLAPALVDEQGWGPIGDVRPPPPDRIVPQGPDMHAGKLVLRAGVTQFAVAYDAVGMRCGVELSGGDSFVNSWQGEERPIVMDPRARPPTIDAYPLLLRDDLDPRGHDVEALVSWIEAACERLVPCARLLAPTPLPLGSQAILLRARTSMAVALWEGLVPHQARWLAADGWCGRAFAGGVTREDAVRGLSEALWRVKPGLPDTPDGIPLSFALPPRRAGAHEHTDNLLRLPTPPRTPEQGGPQTVWSTTMTVSFGGFVSRHSWCGPDPALAPMVLYHVPPAPQVPAAITDAGFAPVAIIGDDGRVAWMLRRRDDDGWTLIGEGVLDLVDVATLDAELDAAEQTHANDWRELYPDGWQGQPRPRMAMFSLWDNLRQRRGAPVHAGSCSGGFHPEQLNACNAPWHVGRVLL